MKRVLVLMSSYNGKKYIKAQIESLFTQKSVDVSLLIRDDGSTDNTVDIIRKMRHRYNEIHIIKGNNCGCLESFMKLIVEASRKYKQFDYYAFCDQDDVWLEDKLFSAVKILETKPNDNPSLYLGAYQMVDSNLNEIKTEIQKPNICLPAAIASNCATGCTMVFNGTLLNSLAMVVIPNLSDIIMHDYWTYVACLSIRGFVYFDETPHILYRQHGDNVIGGLKDPFLKRWIVRFSKLFKKGDKYKSRLASQLLACYSSFMTNKDKKFLEDIVNCNKLSSKIRLLFNKQFCCNSLDSNLKLLILIITGKL